MFNVNGFTIRCKAPQIDRENFTMKPLARLRIPQMGDRPARDGETCWSMSSI